MKKGYLIPVILFCVLGNAFLSADLIKIGVVNLEDVNKQYTLPLVDIKMQFYLDDYKTKALKLKAEIDAIVQKLQNASLTADERAKLEAQKNEKIAAGVEMENSYRKIYEDLQTNRQKYIQDDIRFAVKKIAEKRGYSIVLDRTSAMILYSADWIDLTVDVLNYLFYMNIKFIKDNNMDPKKFNIDPALMTKTLQDFLGF